MLNACSKTTIALTVADSDSSGNAGIQTDFKTFSALGVYGASAIAVVAAQNTCLASHNSYPAGMIDAQISTVMDTLYVAAVKIGILFSAQVIEEVIKALQSCQSYIVLAVMVVKSRNVLLQEDTMSILRQKLIPRAALITLNLPEVAALPNSSVAQNNEQLLEQGRALMALGPVYSAILKKVFESLQGLTRITQWKSLPGDIPLAAIGRLNPELARRIFNWGTISPNSHRYHTQL